MDSSSITLDIARQTIAAAERKATSIGQPMNIAIVCPGGHLLAHVRMDKAWVGSIDISISKAKTARMFDIETKTLFATAQPGKPFYGIQFSNHGCVSILPGGIPLMKDGEVVGAIGVSGGTGDQDHAVAEAGAKAFPDFV